MTTPSGSDSFEQPADASEGSGTDESKVELTKSAAEPGPVAPFDPYRFGKPEHPVPPEYAPLPYQPSAPASSSGQPPYGSTPASVYGQPSGSAPPPSGQPPGNPYSPPYPGYGAPPPAAYHGYAQQPSGNGKAVAALILGIASILLFWLTIFDGFFIVLALIFGVLALNEARSRGGSGRGMAIAGLVCMALGALAATLFTVVFFHAVDQCGGLQNGNSSQFHQCVQDHF